MKSIIGSNQHNEIYSDKCGVLVSGKVSEEITYLFDKVKNLETENAKLRDFARLISESTFELNPFTIVPSKEAILAQKVLKELEE